MSDELIATGKSVIQQEAAALVALAESLDESFSRAGELLLQCQGRVVVTGMGKSGAIARKAASTLASTGTPALFLHPAEGVHGDLGMVAPGDVIIAISQSGESDEIRAILPALQRFQTSIIAVTGREESTLAQAATVTLLVRIEQEACPHNLAPTTSTTAALALLDGLALAVMEARSFTAEDYALYHPAGALGRRLLMRVADLMRTGDQLATCSPDSSVREALFTITKAQAGSALAVDENGRLVGLLSDGDIRRLLLKDEAALGRPIGEALNRDPRCTTADELVSKAAEAFREGPPIGELIVLDDERRPVGVLNLKDVVREGIF